MLFRESQTKGRLSSFCGWAKWRAKATSLTLLAAAVFLTFLALVRCRSLGISRMGTSIGAFDEFLAIRRIARLEARAAQSGRLHQAGRLWAAARRRRSR